MAGTLTIAENGDRDQKGFQAARDACLAKAVRLTVEAAICELRQGESKCHSIPKDYHRVLEAALIVSSVF
jgi:hypothetical protein